MKRFYKIITDIILFPLVALIAFYRACISPLTPPSCRYTPTCSEYMLIAIKKHKFKGVWLGIKRISRCHPWGGSGFDPVPDKIIKKKKGEIKPDQHL